MILTSLYLQASFACDLSSTVTVSFSCRGWRVGVARHSHAGGVLSDHRARRMVGACGLRPDNVAGWKFFSPALKVNSLLNYVESDFTPVLSCFADCIPMNSWSIFPFFWDVDLSSMKKSCPTTIRRPKAFAAQRILLACAVILLEAAVARMLEFGIPATEATRYGAYGGFWKMWDPDFFIIVLDNLHGEAMGNQWYARRGAPFFWKAPCSPCRPETVLVNNDQVYIYIYMYMYVHIWMYILPDSMIIEGVSLSGLNGFWSQKLWVLTPNVGWGWEMLTNSWSQELGVPNSWAISIQGVLGSIITWCWQGLQKDF